MAISCLPREAVARELAVARLEHVERQQAAGEQDAVRQREDRELGERVGFGWFERVAHHGRLRLAEHVDTGTRERRWGAVREEQRRPRDVVRRHVGPRPRHPFAQHRRVHAAGADRIHRDLSSA